MAKDSIFDSISSFSSSETSAQRLDSGSLVCAVEDSVEVPVEIVAGVDDSAVETVVVSAIVM